MGRGGNLGFSGLRSNFDFRPKDLHICIHKNSNKKSSNFTTVLVRIFTNKSLTVRKCTCKSILGKIDLLLDFQNYIFMQKISELSPLILGMGQREARRTFPTVITTKLVCLLLYKSAAANLCKNLLIPSAP